MAMMSLDPALPGAPPEEAEASDAALSAMARAPRDTPQERHALRMRVADWALEKARTSRGQASVLITPPAGCSLSTAFGLLAEGAQFMGQIAQARAELPGAIEAERWFDLKPAAPPLRIERRKVDDPAGIPTSGDRRR